MANDNKISFDLELDEGSINSNFGIIDKRAEKSAKSSAAVFGEYFQKQEQELKESIERANRASVTSAKKSAEESAAVFKKALDAQDKAKLDSVKRLQDRIAQATGTDREAATKSAEASAAAFEKAFKKIDPPDFLNPDSKKAKLNLTEIAAGYFLVKEAIDKVAAAGKIALDFVLRGEAEIKLEQRFKALSEQANIAADVIENKLLKAAQGLVEDDELFQLGSSAFVRIGENAERLPQVLEAARKSYKVFGGEVTANAEAIISATETGNKRALRSVGLYTDLDVAVKNFAAKLGTVPALLTEQQVQQARLNAILETADTRFKNISIEANNITDTFTRAKVSVKEFTDELAKGLAQNTGGFFKALLGGSADFFDRIKDSTALGTQATSASELRKQIDILIKRNQEFRTEIAALDKDSFFYQSSFNGSTLAIQKNEIAIDKLKGKLEELRELQRVQGVNASPNAGGLDNKKDAEVTAEFIRRRTELTNKVKELQAVQTQSEASAAQERFNLLQNESNNNFNAALAKTALDDLTRIQEKQANEQFLIEKNNLEKFYAENGINDAALRLQGREALEANHQAKLLAIKKKGDTDRIKIDEKTNAIQYQATLSAINTIATLQDNSNKELAAIGKAAAITQATINGYVAVTNAFKQVPYPFNFAAAALVGAAAAANVAKIAAVGGGGGGGGANFDVGGGSAGAGGGLDSPNSPITEFVPADSLSPQGPSTSVAVTVNGNILDRRETGLELAEIIRQEFENQGLVVTTG